jgi:AbrB family looped-hinge helix DNA binding protein
MTNLSTTKLSSKGQIVIPETVRNQLGLKAGMEFVVVGDKDMLLLKIITPPDLSRFGRLIQRARSEAHKVSLKKAARLTGSKKRKRK